MRTTNQDGLHCPQQDSEYKFEYMNLSTFFEHLDQVEELTFVLPNGTYVPPHFHLTEVALVSKKFVDCGGTMRDESLISFQLWSADDYDHRLAPCRAYGIVERAQEALGFGNLDIEVEYQGDTIGRYGLEFDNGRFILTAKKTDCLAPDKCGITQSQPVSVSAAESSGSCCSPNPGCC
jgi:hypothetical protein